MTERTGEGIPVTLRAGLRVRCSAGRDYYTVAVIAAAKRSYGKAAGAPRLCRTADAVGLRAERIRTALTVILDCQNGRIKLDPACIAAQAADDIGRFIRYREHPTAALDLERNTVFLEECACVRRVKTRKCSVEEARIRRYIGYQTANIAVIRDIAASLAGYSDLKGTAILFFEQTDIRPSLTQSARRKQSRRAAAYYNYFFCHKSMPSVRHYSLL